MLRLWFCIFSVYIAVLGTYILNIFTVVVYNKLGWLVFTLEADVYLC